MTRRLPLTLLVAGVVLVASQCGPTGMPALTVSGPTSAWRDGTPITLRVVATLADGKVGRGQVTVTTDVGVVMEEGLTLDEFGTATFTFACNVTTNPDCVVDAANLKLRWTTSPPVTLDYVVRLTARPVGGDGGAGGGGPATCVSTRYSRVACSGGLKPDVAVRCCLNMTRDMIPNCLDTYVCDGMRLTGTYIALDGGISRDFEVEFRIPTYRYASFAECMQQPVGFVVRHNGVELDAGGVLHTYGIVDLNGDYFGLRQTFPIGSLRTQEDRECLAVADGGVLGIWHSVPNEFSVRVPGEPVRFYTLATPGRFFFQSLLKR